MQPFEAASDASAARDTNYLFDALIAHIGRRPLRWQLVVVIGQPGDPTYDATIAWPADRERVVVGTLTVDRADAEETSAATSSSCCPRSRTLSGGRSSPGCDIGLAAGIYSVSTVHANEGVGQDGGVTRRCSRAPRTLGTTGTA